MPHAALRPCPSMMTVVLHHPLGLSWRTPRILSKTFVCCACCGGPGLRRPGSKEKPDLFGPFRVCIRSEDTSWEYAAGPVTWTLDQLTADQASVQPLVCQQVTPAHEGTCSGPCCSLQCKVSHYTIYLAEDNFDHLGQTE